MPYLGQRPSKGDENNFKILDNISSYTLTFDGSDSSVVSAANDTITSLNHRFVQGQRVTYNKGGGDVIAGLSDGVYYIIKHDHHTIKLATSASNATNGIAVNITNVGNGSSHTLNVAFDGINTKFKATHTNGQKAKITRSAQLVISINGVIQQPHDTATPSTGFGFDLDGTIVFSQAPTSTDAYWAHVLTNNNVTFDISDNDVDNFTGNASTVSFNLSKTPPDNRNVLVTIEGVVQYPNDPDGTVRAYNVVENVLTFTTAPAAGAEIQVRHIGFAGSTSGSGGGGGVTNFYGRTGSVVLKNTDNIVANNAEFAGNLTVQGTMTTLDTKVTEVDQLEVAANNTTVGVAITQSGSGDILKLYDGSSEVFTVATQGDGVGAVTISSPKPRIVFNETNASPDYQIRMNGGIFSIHDSTNNIGRISITSSRTDINNPVLLNNDTVWIGDKLVHWTDDNTAIRFPAYDTISMETAGSERFRIDPDGHVTVGVAASALYNTYLTIPRYAADGDAAKFISLRNDVAPADVSFVKSRSTTYGSYAATQDDDPIMSINSHIDTGAALAFRGTYRSIFDTATGGVHFMWGSGASPSTTGEKMRLTATGNLGIGTAIPATNLDVRGSSDASITIGLTNGTKYGNFSCDNSATYLYAYNGNDIIFSTHSGNSFNRKVTINNDGQVLIGTTTTPASTNTKFRLHLPINTSSARAFEISHNTNGANKVGAALGLAIDNGGESTNAASLYFSTASNGSLLEKLRITSGGSVNIGSGELTQTARKFNVYGGAARVTQTSGGNTIEVFGGTTSGQSYGLLVNAGTNNSDYTANFRNTSGTTYFRILGDGNIGVAVDAPKSKLHLPVNQDVRIGGQYGGTAQVQNEIEYSSGYTGVHWMFESNQSISWCFDGVLIITGSGSSSYGSEVVKITIVYSREHGALNSGDTHRNGSSSYNIETLGHDQVGLNPSAGSLSVTEQTDPDGAGSTRSLFKLSWSASGQSVGVDSRLLGNIHWSAAGSSGSVEIQDKDGNVKWNSNP